MSSSDRARSFSLADLMLITTTIAMAIIGFTKIFRHYESSTYLNSIMLFAAAMIGWALSWLVVTRPSKVESIVCLLILTVLSFWGGVLNWFNISWLVLGIVAVIAVDVLQPSQTGRLGFLAVWLVSCLISGQLLNYLCPPFRLQRLLEARAAYPIVDLTGRLSRYQPASTAVSSLTQPDLGDPFYADIQSQADKRSRRYSDRSQSLARLHDQKYRDFVESIGFGPVRMVTLGRYYVDLPQIESIPFDARPTTSERTGQDSFSKQFNLISGGLDKEFSSSLDSFPALLRRSYLDFLNPNTLGWSPEFKRAAGFEPHAFRFPVPEVIQEGKRYEIKKLELVGVLVSDEPRVYVLDHLPRMDQISDPKIRTRELNSFEKSALERLIAGENIVLDENQDDIQMVGALRAHESCSKCHDCTKGDLMGAFSYLLSGESDLN